LDRLTRSLLDFARTLEILEKHKVALVSVTQAFDTSTATGKLMMGSLLRRRWGKTTVLSLCCLR
jgi:DNA invertase Pin-like site-specific DNA recombinase